jgi:hypothetical protein
MAPATRAVGFIGMSQPSPGRAICAAIRQKRLLRFAYEGGVRVVEPHQYGKARTGHLLLNAWQRAGGSGVDWRTFDAGQMGAVEIMPEHFSGPRPDYHPDGFPLTRTICKL